MAGDGKRKDKTKKRREKEKKKHTLIYRVKNKNKTRLTFRFKPYTKYGTYSNLNFKNIHDPSQNSTKQSGFNGEMSEVENKTISAGKRN